MCLRKSLPHSWLRPVLCRLSPLSVQFELCLAVSDVAEKVSFLCEGFHQTNWEKNLISKVQNGTGPDSTDWDLKPLSLCYTDQSALIVLKKKDKKTFFSCLYVHLCVFYKRFITVHAAMCYKKQTVWGNCY